MSTFRRFLAMLDEGINSDEDVIFYPSIGIHPAGGSRCEVEVRGRITEESHLDLADFALTLAGVPDINALTDFLGHVKSARDENDSSRLFTERVKHFVLDGESEEQFPIRIGDTSAASVRSGSHGFFGFLVPRLTVPASAAAAAVQGHTGQWLSYTATSGNGRTFTGKSLLLRARGVIVVSDIDDTIKDSNVPEPHELVANTLFRPYRHTPGMPETFQAWAAIGADFVYLSNSPYQLYEPLTDYLQRQVGFPEGAYYMRRLGGENVRRHIANVLTIDSRDTLRESPKKHNLIPILEAFPERQFVLVGDSTELDADIYVDLYEGTNWPSRFQAPANGYKDRIKKIYIRDVKNSTNRAAAVKALARIGDREIADFFDPDQPRLLEKVLPLFSGARI